MLYFCASVVSEAKIYVTDEQSIVRTMIDIQNLIAPGESRITGTEALVYEAFVMSYRTLGSINSVSADAFIKAYINKPAMAKRSFNNYRNALVRKGWMTLNKENYVLIPAFRLHNVPLEGVLATIYLKIERISGEVGSSNIEGQRGL